MAPELTKKLSYGSGVDIWAVGVIAFLLLTGSYPFIADSASVLYEEIQT